MFALRLSRGTDPSVDVPLDGSVTIGRDASADVQLEDGQVSRRHARLEPDGDGCLLFDCASMNGTFLYGNRLDANRPTRLQVGQCFTVGDFTLELVEDTTQTLLDVGTRDPGVTFDRRLLVVHRDDLGEPVETWTEGERELTVCGTFDEAAHLRTFRFAARPRASFDYAPGQRLLLTLQLPTGPVTRSFPIGSSPSRPHLLEVTVEHGYGDEVLDWMASQLTPGMSVRAQPPEGEFSCFEAPASHLLLLAEDAGLVPMVSMLRWITDVGAPVDVSLVATASSPEHLGFRAELESLAARHPNVQVTLCADRGGDAGTVRGPVDANLIAAATSHVPDREVFACGSAAFLERMDRELDSLLHPTSRRHTDRPGSRPGSAVRSLPARWARTPAQQDSAAGESDDAPLEPRRAGSSPVGGFRRGRGLWPFARSS